jgi:hypothetical protein
MGTKLDDAILGHVHIALGRNVSSAEPMEPDTCRLLSMNIKLELDGKTIIEEGNYWDNHECFEEIQDEDRYGKCIDAKRVTYCPVRAIAAIGEGDPSVSEIIQRGMRRVWGVPAVRCLPHGCLCMPPLEWPRSIRAAFSNPLSTHRSINEEGRGPEEMKTNDVTGRFPRGIAGVMIEIGRPGTGTTFKDLQLVSAALAKVSRL